MLGVALGTNSTTHGMLIRGMAQVSQSGQVVPGQPVYIHDDGIITGSVDDYGSDDIARVVGYCVGGSANNGSASIYFNPANTWVEVTA